MQSRVFFASFLATILAVGVIATPVNVEGASTNEVDTVFEKVENVASLVGAVPDPRPNEPILTPKEGDVPAPSNTTDTGSVVARDLVSIKPSSICLVWSTVTNSHNRRVWKREPRGVLP